MTYVAKNTLENTSCHETPEAQEPTDTQSVVSLLGQLSPTAALTIGLVAGLLILGTIGFVVLFVLLF